MKHVVEISGGNCDRRMQLLLSFIPRVGEMITIEGKVLGNVDSISHYIRNGVQRISVIMVY